MHLKTGLPPGKRAYPPGVGPFWDCIICMICKICKICFYCPPPRVRLAGLRSNAAVDMFGRWAAITLNLFWSGNAQHAVPHNTRLHLCWSYANNVPNNLPQPLRSVPMVPLSVLFIADVRDKRIAIFNSQTTRARTKNIQKLLQHIIKKSDSETAFKNLNQGGKVLSPNYVFHNLLNFIPCHFWKINRRLRSGAQIRNRQWQLSEICM